MTDWWQKVDPPQADLLLLMEWGRGREFLASEGYSEGALFMSYPIVRLYKVDDLTDTWYCHKGTL